MDEDYSSDEGQAVAPSLVDLCINTAIDNLRRLGDVGETDSHLLKRILPHCTVDQLMHVEKSTKGRDLTPITDNLWKKFYEKEFGITRVNEVIERMKQKKVAFRWSQLYEAKLKEVDMAENLIGDKLKSRYQEANARKQSRQVQICTKVPPSSNKRSWGNGPGYNVTGKSNLMKKAKLDFLKSNEVKNLAAMKRNALQKSYSAPPVKRPDAFSGKASASNSKPIKPPKRLPF
ncbi:transcription elongation factor B polypeptide 3-like [Pyrus ussuriensis x Pyrus communis]|uniref:Transcription elongation factor B polypeptide 3-like n=1 Tax=Pyrus ussuriensis x Pyrus communis TaxID=2448454 RepID=A0A5N5H0Q6_9ROSA|nr:transcription elongation factor B polypeptide 3-like [Pyrus ussuriensis x Pyrus communis]